METDREKRAREERIYRRWDKAGPWILPAGFFVMIAITAIADALK